MHYSPYVGTGVGLSEFGLGRIIELVPAKKNTQLRLSDQTLETMQQLAETLGKKRAEVVELALTHLDGTLRAGQPVHILPPPTPPASHKRRSRVA